MTEIKAKIEFGCFFSYRIPDFSSQYALSSLLPSPASVKLAIVATAIQYKGKNYGKEIFELIKNKEIGFKIIGRIVSNNFLLKRLKKAKTREGFESTFGVRGYIFYENPLEILIKDINEELKEKLREILIRIRYLGTSDSICLVSNIEEVKERGENWVFAKKGIDEKAKDSLIIPTKDLSPDDTFEKIDIYYRKEKPKLENKFFQIPIREITQSGNWIIYATG